MMPTPAMRCGDDRHLHHDDDDDQKNDDNDDDDDDYDVKTNWMRAKAYQQGGSSP